MGAIKTHKDLDIWKKGITFVVRIYDETKNFPEHEKYGIISQLRRAAVSIPTNIAEGFGRNHKKELLQFLNIAMGSAAEIDTLLLISKELNFLTNVKYEELNELLDQHIQNADKSH